MWTAKNRRRYDRSALRYPSDLTDDEWAHVESLIPPARRGGNKRHVDVREVMNGIMYVLSTGCQWRAIPKDLPPRSTLFDYLDLWSYDGTLDRIHHALYVECREQGEREASPTAAIIDSQSVKSAEKGGPASIRMAMMRQKDQGQEAPYSRRYAGFAAARDCSSGRYPRPRRRHSASCDTVRNVSVLEKAVCRRRLSGTGIPEGLGENPPLSRN
jgi:transposase